MRTVGAIVWLLVTLASVFAGKPRLLVLTDIGGDPDDTQSLVRLLVHSNEIEIEGLVASAAGTPGELKEKVTRPEMIRELVEAYGKVRGNLVEHAEGFPETGALLSVVKSGNSERGKDAIGEGMDTEGSAWIIGAVDREDARLLDIAVWGGQTDLAQALWRVRKDRGEEGVSAFLKKMRVYDIADQDGVQGWIHENFPDAFYVLNKVPDGKDKRNAVFRGMYLSGDLELTSLKWLDENVRKGHGPLGALYPPKTHTAPSHHQAMKEGDSPSWLRVFPNGLDDAAHPEWDGWGGRFQSKDGKLFRDTTSMTDAKETVSRWRPDFQNEFAARMDWCVTDDFKKANHPPVAVLNGDKTMGAIRIEAKRGVAVKLSSEGSGDPDGDGLEAEWIVFDGAKGMDGGEKRMEGKQVEILPSDFKTAARIHAVLVLRDKGSPPITRYRRAVIAVGE